jgi:mRNA-degrading endonuclease RelE of RelBE toxin-antitoxin system
MGLKICYHPKVVSEDIPNLPKANAARIKKAIESKLTTHPETFGTPLRGSLVPLWKLRMGDYRIVYDLRDSKVYIHAIGHRKHIYTRIANNRDRE